MSKFSAPADELVHETRGYIEAQLDGVKLSSVKGLAKGTSALTSFLLIFILAGAVLIALSFALVLWLGEALGSYSLAAFIVAGVLLLALVVLLLLRKRLFKNSFVPLYADIFFQKESKSQGLDNLESLDQAIAETEVRIRNEEAGIADAFAQFQAFYTPKRFLNEGLRILGGHMKTHGSGWKILAPIGTLLFGKKKKKGKKDGKMKGTKNEETKVKP